MGSGILVGRDLTGAIRFRFMTCDKREIICAIEGISQSISEPTPLDVATFWVAAIGMVATVGIAVLNLVLLRKQHLMSLAEQDRVRHERRGEYVHLMSDLIRAWASEMLNLERLTPEEERDRLSAIARAGGLTNEPSQKQLRVWLIEQLKYRYPAKYNQAITRHMTDTLDVLARWKENPASVSDEIKDAYPPARLGEPTVE